MSNDRKALEKFREEWKAKHIKDLRSKYNASVRDRFCGELVKEYADCCKDKGINVLKCRSKWRNVLLCVKDNFNQKEFEEFQNKKLSEREHEVFTALMEFRGKNQTNQ